MTYTTMTKTLIVSPEFPYPSCDGHKVRVYNLLRNLPAQCRFDFLSFGEANLMPGGDELRIRLGASCDGVELISHETMRVLESKSFIKGIRNIFFPFKDTLGEPRYSDAMAAKVKERIATGSYDVVLLCGFSSFLYFDTQRETIPYIVDICDSISLFMQSKYKNERRPLLKLRTFLNYVWACRYERIHASTIKNMILISDVDAAQLRQHCAASNIWVISNGVDTEYFKSSGLISEPNSLLFTGVMEYAPNDEAMLHFIKEIYPLVKKRVSDVILTIAGRNPTSRLKNLVSQTSGVRLTGFVEDLRCYFESATVYVSPLLSGAGMKNKVLEAWSMALPVVATSVSCAGLAVRNNENILIADEPAEIADRVVELLVDRGRREKLSRNGRATVESDYSWNSRSSMLHAIFEDVISGA